MSRHSHDDDCVAYSLESIEESMRQLVEAMQVIVDAVVKQRLAAGHSCMPDIDSELADIKGQRR